MKCVRCEGGRTGFKQNIVVRLSPVTKMNMKTATMMSYSIREQTVVQ